MSVLALSFHEIKFDVIDRNNQAWLRLHQIGVALGYSRADAVNKIYQSNADEFTDSMTALVDLDTNGGKQQVRIFSLRGCHLLAMFARTAVAKEFRKWVLDVLEQHAQTEDFVSISLNGGTRFVAIKFDGNADTPQRYFVDIFQSDALIKPIPLEAMVLTEKQFVEYMIKERGYVVLRKSEVLPKLLA